MSAHTRTGTGTTTKHQTGDAPRYNVVMHNDDYTTMEFVVELLRELFHKTPDEATRIMLAIHNNGQAVCGCYTYEIAETKVLQAHHAARQAQFPLRCSIKLA